MNSCNCMDENCPNSVTPPYDRVRVPYQQFIDEQDVSGRVDVVGAAVNARYNIKIENLSGVTMFYCTYILCLFISRRFRFMYSFTGYLILPLIVTLQISP